MFDIVSGNFTSDLDGNLISACVSPMNPFNTNAEPNQLFISKNANDLSKEWQLTIDNNIEYFPHYLVTDKYGDILVAGEHVRPDLPGKRRNFLLKIFSDGTFTSLPEFPQSQEWIKLWPNPVSDILNIEHNIKGNLLANIYSIDGKLIRQLEDLTSLKTLDVSQLSAGIYLIKVYLKNHPNYGATGQFIKK